MKIRSIISGLCLMLLAASCSMEDDVLNEVGKAVIEETDRYAEFDLSLLGGTLMTKATETEVPDEKNTTENVVNSCYIAAFLGDKNDLTSESKIIASAFYSTYQKDAINSTKDPCVYTLGNHMILKVPVKSVDAANKPKVTFVAIANILADGNQTKNDLEGFMANCKTYGDILNQRITKTDPNIFVKVGSATISDYKVREKVLEECTKDNCTEVDIPVSQLSAAILLEEFKVRIQTGTDQGGPVYEEVSNAEVKSVSLLNAVTSTYVGKADPEMTLRSVGPISVGDENSFHPDYITVTPKPTYKAINDIRFYTYANKSTDVDKQTALQVVYTVNGVESTSTFKIKKDGVTDVGVQSGNIYKLYVTITNSVATLKLVVTDWKHNRVEQTMEEVFN